MNRISTRDFSKFGLIEKQEAEDILKAWRINGLPDRFDGEKVSIEFYFNTGEVFLVNENNDMAMEADGSLYYFHTCPECEYQNSKDDMVENGNACCKKYLKEFYS